MTQYNSKFREPKQNRQVPRLFFPFGRMKSLACETSHDVNDIITKVRLTTLLHSRFWFLLCYSTWLEILNCDQGVVTYTWPVEAFVTNVACRSVCDQDQNGIKRSTFSLGPIKRSRILSYQYQWSIHFLRYLADMAMFCPLNSHRIKRSRASEWSYQMIKDDFHWSSFLIPGGKVI